MKLGVAVPSFATDRYRLPPGRLQRYARQAEAYGFAGIWTTEHLVRPPAYNSSRLDPLTTLSTVAGVTETAGLGTSILILPMRNPVLVAKRAATLQHLTGDRLTLGLGIGWYEKEYEVVDVPFEERGERFTEGLELITRLFSEESVTFDGDFFQVKDLSIEPRPNQTPRILIAGTGSEVDGEYRVLKSVKERILRHGDGWIGAARSPDVLNETWRDIASYLSAHDRDPETFDTVALNWCHMISHSDSEVARRHQRKVYGKAVSSSRGVDFAMEHNLSGSADEIRSQLGKFEDGGFDQVIVGPMAYDPIELMEQLKIWSSELLTEFGSPA